MIHFQRKQRSIQNALNGEEYALVALDLIAPTEDVIAQVTSICNEPLVYYWLFRTMLSGQPYPPSKAGEWFNRAAAGWKKNEHFVFGVIDREGGIVAACDIKSATPGGAEIGYWSSGHHRGVMTNAVLGLIDLATEAGFKRLFAETHEENVRSQRVLRRAGFELSDQKPARSNHHIVFSLSTERSRTEALRDERHGS